MTPERASTLAIALNENGKHREDWVYYATFINGIRQKGWAVMRRRKDAQIHPAVYVDGELSYHEVPGK